MTSLKPPRCDTVTIYIQANPRPLMAASDGAWHYRLKDDDTLDPCITPMFPCVSSPCPFQETLMAPDSVH